MTIAHLHSVDYISAEGEGRGRTAHLALQSYESSAKLEFKENLVIFRQDRPLQQAAREKEEAAYSTGLYPVRLYPIVQRYKKACAHIVISACI